MFSRRGFLCVLPWGVEGRLESPEARVPGTLLEQARWWWPHQFTDKVLGWGHRLSCPEGCSVPGSWGALEVGVGQVIVLALDPQVTEATL